MALTTHDAKIAIGMLARGDNQHDVAAWFGENQARIVEASKGHYGTIEAAPADELPPKGAPGLKGRLARYNLGEIEKALNVGDTQKALAITQKAIARFDANGT